MDIQLIMKEIKEKQNLVLNMESELYKLQNYKKELDNKYQNILKNEKDFYIAKEELNNSFKIPSKDPFNIEQIEMEIQNYKKILNEEIIQKNNEINNLKEKIETLKKQIIELKNKYSAQIY